MSDEDYSSYSGYYHHPPLSPEAYPIAGPTQSWNRWNSQQQQYMQHYGRRSLAYNSNSVNHNSHSNHPQNYRNPGYRAIQPHHNNRPYYRHRYNSNTNNQYSGNQQQHGPNWQRKQNNNKRNRVVDASETEPQLKTAKKKKKPLSQNVPNKKEWTMEEAEQALAVEKEHNKKSKNALIVKFPDQELNKEIVSQFHSSIENVHFQQPCTPRFCFVTLQESADPDEVMGVLNKQTFGDGLLSVEYKRDREEDQTINPEDIDPLTLYVGNLAQEITKDDMLTMYPNCRRIDIGFAKKMKYTRYAFVGFRTVTDTIEAFKNTHNKQMYNKSLIIRFRRLHGTVGMPGESKPQNPPKTNDNLPVALGAVNGQVMTERATTKIQNELQVSSGGAEAAQYPLQPLIPPSSEEFSDINSDLRDVFNLELIKRERGSPNDSGDELFHERSYSPSNLDDYSMDHQATIKVECKREVKKEVETLNPNNNRRSIPPTIKTEDAHNSHAVKDEPCDCNDDLTWSRLYFNHDDSDEAEEEVENVTSRVTDFDTLYETMVNHANKINSLKKTEI